jgi:alpha-methylacyl-CoA racemase
MMLADMGADVIRIERTAAGRPPESDPTLRNRRSIVCDLKHPDGVNVLLQLVKSADGLFEGFRPGVAERLGVGPDDCLEVNPRLVYGRITGWGQTGPLAQAAGHDLNYIALSGALLSIGSRDGKPVPPLNLVGDYGGGGMLLAFGMVCALLSAQRTGAGQVVDAAMLDGVNAMMALFHGLKALGLHDDSGPGQSFLGGAAHYYNTYETADGKFVAVAPLEPQFYDVLIDKLGLDRTRFEGAGFAAGVSQEVARQWSELKAELADVFSTRRRDEWCELLEGTDACFAPVLTMAETLEHAHIQARESFVDVGNVKQPAPAPRFSETPTAKPRPSPARGADARLVLQWAGYSEAEIESLFHAGVVLQ